MSKMFEQVKISNSTSKQLSNEEHKSFPFGRVIDIHRISEYEIIEFIPLAYMGEHLTLRSENCREFFINNYGLYCNTLDEAIVCAIARKHDGINSEAHIYFMRMINYYEK